MDGDTRARTVVGGQGDKGVTVHGDPSAEGQIKAATTAAPIALKKGPGLQHGHPRS